MKEMNVLDLKQIDLPSLAEALEDHSDEQTWWFDPQTGEVQSRSEYLSSEEEEGHPGDLGLIPVEPLPSNVGYGDMEDFIERVGDARARELLQRAIEGRGAFRRKDTLLEFADLRRDWFAFHDARTERRALQWLADEGIVDPEIAETEMGRRADPELPELGGGLDPDALARAVAKDLRGDCCIGRRPGARERSSAEVYQITRASSANASVRRRGGRTSVPRS